MHLPGDGGGPPLNSYRIGPFVYVTELLLPELPPGAPEAGERPVHIRLGKAPAALRAPLATAKTFLKKRRPPRAFTLSRIAKF